jgi:leader peptidase (prepilin peptidase)/N-methyltransferase
VIRAGLAFTSWVSDQVVDGPRNLDPMTALRLPFFALAGLVFGSFLTVLVYRIPRGESVVLPGSACPQCGTPISPRDNIPVVSYVALRGRCRHCGARISAQYPMTEAMTAALFVGAALALHSIWQAVLIAPFLGIVLACALIDARHRIIPNRIVYWSLAIFAAVIALFSFVGLGVSLLTGVLGLLAFGGGLLLVAIVAPHGMGMGDVKLAALMGLVLGSLGWRYVGVSVVVAVLAGGLGGIFTLLAGGSRKDAIPFGPYLASGGVLSALFAPHIATWYTGLLH